MKRRLKWWLRSHLPCPAVGRHGLSCDRARFHLGQHACLNNVWPR